MLKQLFNDWIDNHPWRLFAVSGPSSVFSFLDLDAMSKGIALVTALASGLLVCTTLYRKWWGPKKLNRTIISEILIIDDDANDLMLFSGAFHAAGCHVTPAHSFQKATDFLSTRKRCDLVLLDARIPGHDPIQMIQEIKTLRPDLGVVVFSGLVDTHLMEELDKVDATIMVVRKPNGHKSPMVFAKQLINDYKFGRPI